nr:DMT family transporter [uncultured Roseovarius sp.]
MTDTALPQIVPRRSLAMGMMVVGSIAISFSGLVLRFMEEADAWQIAFYRSWAVLGMIILVLLVRYGRAMPSRIRAVGLPGLIAGGFMSVSTISFLQSITNTTVANTLFMMSAIPFITALIARVLLGEKLRRATALTMIGAIIGIAVMLAGSVGGGGLYGNAMGLVTALCFSGYAITVRRHREIEMLPTVLIAATIVICISGVVRWGDLWVPPADVARALFLGGVLSALTNVLFIAASKHLIAAEVTLFMLLEFAIGPVWVWLIIAEVPKDTTIIGGAIVIAAVALRALNEIAQSRTRRARPAIRPH